MAAIDQNELRKQALMGAMGTLGDADTTALQNTGVNGGQSLSDLLSGLSGSAGSATAPDMKSPAAPTPVVPPGVLTGVSGAPSSGPLVGGPLDPNATAFAKQGGQMSGVQAAAAAGNTGNDNLTAAPIVTPPSAASPAAAPAVDPNSPAAQIDALFKKNGRTDAGQGSGFNDRGYWLGKIQSDPNNAAYYLDRLDKDQRGVGIDADAGQPQGDPGAAQFQPPGSALGGQTATGAPALDEALTGDPLAKIQQMIASLSGSRPNFSALLSQLGGS